MKKTITYEMTAKYKGGKGIKFKLGTALLKVAVRLMNTKVSLYISDKKVMEAKPVKV